MNEKEFYKIAGRLETGGTINPEHAQALYSLCLNFIDILDDIESEEGDIFGTQGWRYLLGWES